MSFQFPFGRPPVTGYSIARSLRFNSADTAYLNRTPGVAGNRTKFTISFWMKRGKLGTTMRPLSTNAANTDTETFDLLFNASDQLAITGWSVSFLTTTRVFRDPSAWYHIVVAVDTTQGTANNRIRLYVNGVEETAFGTRNNPSSSANMGWCNATLHRIGIPTYASSEYFDGYLADFYSIDGAQLTASDFGQTDATTGQWVPKQYTGSFGTTGFWLSFYDNTSTTTLGRDDAGGAAGSAAGSNDWTLNNFSVTAGTGNDSLTDTPTNNYPVLNVIGKGANNTHADGNLSCTTTASGSISPATIPFPTSGKWYFEYTCTTTSNLVGIITEATPVSSLYVGSTTGGYGYYSANGNKYNNTSATAYGNSYTTNDVIGIAFDADNGKLYFSKNGTWQNSGDPVAGTNAAFTGLTGNTYFPAVGNNASGAGYVNFGQRAFTTSPPSGFSALCTSNLPTPSIVKPNAQFDVETYTGTGATRSKTGLAFQPSLVWFKGRSGATDHALYDSVRGVQKQLESNTTTAETTETTGLTAFNSDGYTTGALAQLNTNAATYVSWLWKEGVTPGFDIISGTSTGTSGTLTVAHNLGVAPAFIIARARPTTDTAYVWHKSFASPLTGYLALQTTAAVATAANIWGTTGHTSSNCLFGQGTFFSASSQDLVAYVFAEVAGFSKFGSYTGNASTDGPFVHCGFRPKWILIKRSDTAGNNWRIYDTARDVKNAATGHLYTNTADLEDQIGGAADMIDILSNGFKLRTSGAAENASGGTYIYAAFAEFPFKYANAR